MALVDIDTDRWVLCEAGDGGEGRSDRSDPPAQPSDGSGQGNVGPAEQVGGNFQALGRLSHGHALLNRIEQVWQSGGKEVRQQAERPMPLGTIPSRDAQPLWHQPWIAAVTGKRASTRRMQRTSGQSGCAPLLIPDIRRRTRSRMQRDLHRPPAATLNIDATARIMWSPLPRYHRARLRRNGGLQIKSRSR